MSLSKYLESKFAFGGRGPKFYDCYGLAKAIYKEKLNIILPEIETPELLHDIYVKCDESVKYFDEIEKPKSWCLVAFEIKPPFVSHVGIILPGLKTFIHAFHKSGIVIQKLRDPVWSRKIKGYYTYASSES